VADRRPERQTDRQTDVPAVAWSDVDFYVYVNRVSDVDLFRLVSWKIRLFSILLYPPDWTESVASMTMRVHEVFVDDAHYALQ